MYFYLFPAINLQGIIQSHLCTGAFGINSFCIFRNEVVVDAVFEIGA